MYKQSRILIINILFFVSIIGCFAIDNNNFTHEVKGYIPTWKGWTADDVDGSKLTELVVSFLLVEYVDDTKGQYKVPVWNPSNGQLAGHKSVTYLDRVSDRIIEPETYEQLKILRERYPNLKITVALGGWGADGFSDAVLTKKSRDNFTTSIVDYLVKYDFDGLDIDWEFPVSGGWGIIKARSEDRRNFTYFIKQLRTKIDAAESSINKKLRLSVAANPSQQYFNEWVNLKEVVKYVDHVNLMTYDNVGSWAGKAQHHTSVKFTEIATERFLKAGVPADKLIIGGAFYGKQITKVKGLNKKLNKNSVITDISWDDIYSNCINGKGYIRYWDDNEKSPYLYNKSKDIFITYDDPDSLREKSKLVKKHDLGGIFFWDYSHDTSGKLLDAISKDFIVK